MFIFYFLAFLIRFSCLLSRIVDGRIIDSFSMEKNIEEHFRRNKFVDSFLDGIGEKELGLSTE